MAHREGRLRILSVGGLPLDNRWQKISAPAFSVPENGDAQGPKLDCQINEPKVL